MSVLSVGGVKNTIIDFKYNIGIFFNWDLQNLFEYMFLLLL